MTYYDKCKRYAETLPDLYGDLPFGTYRFVAPRLSLWHAEMTLCWGPEGYAIVASGRTRELACKRLWETLVEDYGVKENG